MKAPDGGFCNLVGWVATVGEKMAGDESEGSEVEADYLFSVEVLDAALAAVDLPYGEPSCKQKRVEALAKLNELVKEIRP